MLADRVLRRFAANLMLLEELLDERRERLGRTPFRPRGILRRHTPQVADEGFGDLGKGVRR